MTNHSLPTGPTGPEGDSEKKKWGYKRQQFDAVISTTRFNGAIDHLVNETIEVRSLLAILDELNASNQRGRYMAEVLALKQESRRLATVPFSERVAEFLREGARRIPWLSDGLASQMAVALASAADNAAYLDTVNTAVSNLLLDLSRPLKPDTRNYLRALTDKIDATRRLQEARGQLATVPSVYPPAIPDALANAQSPEPPPTHPTSARAFSGKPVAGSKAAPPPKPQWREPGSLEPKLELDSADPTSALQQADPKSDFMSEAGTPDEAAHEIAAAHVLSVGEASAATDADEYVDLEPVILEPGPRPAPPPAAQHEAGAWREPGAEADLGSVPDARPELEAGRLATAVGLGPTGAPSAESPDLFSGLAAAATVVGGPGELERDIANRIDAAEALGAHLAGQDPVARARQEISSEQTITLNTDGQSPAQGTLPTGQIHSRQPPATSRASLKPSRRPQKTPVSTAKIVTAQTASAAALSKPVGHTKSANIVRSVPPGRTEPGIGAAMASGQFAAPQPASPSPIGHSQISDGEPLKIPIRGVPIWILAVSVSGMIAGGVGIWLLVHNAKSGNAGPEPSASAAASAAASAKPGKGPKPPNAVASALAQPQPAQNAQPSAVPAVPVPPAPQPPAPHAVPAPQPPAPPAAVAPTHKAPTTKVNAAPIVRTPPAVSPAPKPVPAPKSAPKSAPAAPKSVAAPPAPKPEPVKPPPSKATSSASEPEPAPALTTPKPSRTIDDILLELLQVPNDPDSIEAKAHDVARIVARTTWADADHILRRLIPEEVLAGSENADTRTLEPVRRVVALLLKKVAVDKDDNRAALAIDSLGEWAKSRKHGGAAKLTLDQLAEDPVVLSRPKRLRALERVQARLGISNVGE